jgi:hypothetical protein
MIVDLWTRLSKENVLKLRTYSVGAAHILACILRKRRKRLNFENYYILVILEKLRL